MATPSEIEAAKRSLRAGIRSRQADRSEDERLESGRQIARRFLQDPVAVRAHRVALFAADASEPATRPLFEALADRGIPRLLPRVEGRRLAFAGVRSWEELVVGRFGILAPPEDAPGSRLEPDDAVLVPGLAFDARGWRLGRGGGYYDRAFPPGRPGPLLIGAAFRSQLVADVPHDSRDRAMDAIVTADELRWVSREP